MKKKFKNCNIKLEVKNNFPPLLTRTLQFNIIMFTSSKTNSTGAVVLEQKLWYFQ